MTKPDDYVYENGVDYGIRKRELIAIEIMAALATPCTPGSHNRNDERECRDKAEMAVRLADALIDALNKKRE